MRKRNVHIQFWLDKKEAEAFQKKVKKSGLSREAYLRHLVNGLEPQDAPPPDYYAMMRSSTGSAITLIKSLQKPIPSKLILTICSAASPELYMVGFLLSFRLIVLADSFDFFLDNAGAFGYTVT